MAQAFFSAPVRPSPLRTPLSRTQAHARTHARTHTHALSQARAQLLVRSCSSLSFSRSLYSFMCVYLSCSRAYRLASQCQTCEIPQVCLAYAGCLQHGRVILGGQDVSSFTSFVWTADALKTLLTATNISTSDLTCERNKHTCHHAEDLNQNNCTSKDLKAVATMSTLTCFLYKQEMSLDPFAAGRRSKGER